MTEGDAREVRVYARRHGEPEQDVTEGVQALYDHMTSSMDWGSGFLTVEDAEGIIRLAQTCGFEMPESAAAAFENYAERLGQGDNNVICAECGEGVRYHYPQGRHGTPAFVPGGWRHVAHDPGHEPRLWR